MPTMTTARDRPPEEAAEDTSFARGLRVLLTIADRGEIRADELATTLELSMSTLYRYLRTLTEFGFVERYGGGYGLGPRLLIGSGPNVSSEELIRAADPVLRALAIETGETALISRRIGLSSICLHEVPSEHALRVTLGAGHAGPLDAGAIARVLLAYAPEEILDEVVAGVPGAGDEPARRGRTSQTRATPVSFGPTSATSWRPGSPGVPASTFPGRWPWPFPSCGKMGSWRPSA